MKLPGSRWLRRLSSRNLLAMGLSSILICVLLLSDLVGLIPDRQRAVREGRIALSESVALTCGLLTASRNAEALAAYLAVLLERNPELTGLRVRSADGEFAIELGQPAPAQVGHDASAQASVTASTDVRMVVPVLGEGALWGHAEMHFKPVSWLAEWLPWLPPAAPLALFLGALCSVAFHLYLKRMLRHLDPSNAIPDRVKTAFDTLAEGVLVLNAKGEIVMANGALAQVAGLPPEALSGRLASSLPWVLPQAGASASGGQVPPMPWVATLADGQQRSAQALRLLDSQGEQRALSVNCSPIRGAGSATQGVLVSLNDVTELE